MTEKILIIDDDLDTLRLVSLMLQKQGYQTATANSGQQGLDLALTDLPDMVLLDVMMPEMNGYEVARRLRADEKTVNIPILMFTAKSQLDDKVTGFEAGADDYLTKPTHPTELQAHVKALLARSAKNKAGSSGGANHEKPAYIIGVIAARGGLGVTTIASNLAASLVKKTGLDVVLAEFRPGQGPLALDLGLAKPNGLTELLKMPPTGITRQQVRDHLSLHNASGIHVLASSSNPRDGLLIANTQQFDVILSCLTYTARYLIIDLGNGITPLVEKLGPHFDEILVTVEPFEHSLRHSLALLDALKDIGIEKNRLHVLINYQLRSDSQLSTPQVQEHLQHPIEVTFPPAPELFLQAAQLQTPAVLVQPESFTGQQFLTLASNIETRALKPVLK
jgi:DNA-binding response OmpR family regulator